MADDDFANRLAQTYADMHSAGDLRNKLAGDPSIPPPTPYENVMEQARGLHSNLTHADPVEMAMGLLGPRVRIPNPMKPLYHGSPADFAPEPGHPLGRFDMSKIGTGEGAQAYGHGLYFAEHPTVAEGYKERLSQPLYRGLDFTITHEPNPRGDWSALGVAKDGTAIVGNRFATEKEATEWANAQRAGDNKGKMYEVALHATPEQFLDWDKPLAGQSEAVRGAIEPLRQKVWQDWQAANPTLHEPTHIGQVLAERGPEAAGALSELGIPGIKYLDQGSRTPKVLYAGQPEAPKGDLAAWLAMDRLNVYRTPEEAIKQLLANGRPEYKEAADLIRNGTVKQHQEGTSNYVVWSPEIIEILRKYGLMGPAALGAASAALPPDKAPQQ